jgi:poly-beta-1,6-N-acetyl-D-glucosamine N-deacetylase
MRKVQYKFLSILSILFKNIYKNRLRVLAYHDVVDAAMFESQIKYLKTNYNIVSIEDVKNNVLKNHALPPFPLLLTFDDGDISVLETGLPILKKYNCPACIFIITDLINSNSDFWFKTVRRKLKDAGLSIEEITIKMNHLKSVPNSERLEEIKKFGTLPKKQLTEADLDFLINNNIFIGNHSHTHPMFNNCEPVEITSEIKNVINFFESINIQGYDVFAYPNGNWDENSESILKQMSINLAFLFDHKINSKSINPYRISRIRANSDMGIHELKTKVSGLHSAFQAIKK